MVRLILKYLNKIKNLFVILPLLAGVMILLGLFFANEKSKPEFESPSERIMFETKNKSPKYVMTLPEVKKDKPAALSETDFNKPKEVVPQPRKKKTNNDKLNKLQIPFLTLLPVRGETKILDHLSPLESLQSSTEDGLKLPIKEETLKPWEVYGRKEEVMPMFSKVAVVLKNMGVNKNNADIMMQRLDSNISLSFSPYTTNLPIMIKKARENGHETYLDIILPARDFAATDSGPKALNYSKTPEENIEELEKVLGQNIAVGGMTINDGIDDAEYNPYFLAVMTMLEKRGLLLLDATHGINVGNNNVNGLDRVRADIIIDNDFDRKAVRQKLQQAEQLAVRHGNVVIVAEPKPVVVLELATWIKSFSKQLSYEEMKAQNVSEFEKPLILVPLSNLAGEY